MTFVLLFIQKTTTKTKSNFAVKINNAINMRESIQMLSTPVFASSSVLQSGPAFS